MMEDNLPSMNRQNVSNVNVTTFHDEMSFHPEGNIDNDLPLSLNARNIGSNGGAELP